MNRQQRRAAAKNGKPLTAERRPEGQQISTGALRSTAMHHFQAGQYTEASRICQRVLATNPDDIVCLHLAGLMALHAGQNRAAADILSRAIGQDDTIADLHSHLAEALQRLGRIEQAITHYRRAISLDPAHVEAIYNSANVLLRFDRHEEALHHYDRVLTIQPGFAEALHNRGSALLGLKRYREALVDYDRALAIKPDFAYALRNRGNVLLELKRYEEALDSYERALAVDPRFVVVLNDRGNALSGLGRYAEAARDFERLLAMEPNHDYARGALLVTNLYCCDWRDYDQAVARVANDIVAGKRAAVPYLSLFICDSLKVQQECARTYSQDKFPASEVPLWRGEHYQHEKIRIAYMSSDFYRHATAYLMAGLFEAHDASRFEITAISFGPNRADDVTEKLKESFKFFIDVEDKNDRAVAEIIKDMEIDIAVDLKGYCQHSRPGILSLRAAPVQVSFLGYPGTMGADYVDYLLVDKIVVPEDQCSFYQEKIVYLPNTYQPNDSRRHIGRHTPTRAEAGLPKAGFIFCCFNQHYKIAPPIFDIWMRLLDQVDDSILWLMEGDAAAVDNLRREAEKRGVSANRLIFAPRVKPEDHLARHRVANLLLDTLPYNAHTTASDALWTGLPIVTCLGSSFAGRVAASLLNAVGLPELITTNLVEYEALALKLARDPIVLGAIKSRLSRNRKTFPLFDTDRFRRDIENAYRTMWERCQRGEPPANFAVTPG